MLINALDRSLLARLAYLIEEATATFEKYEYARALQICESFFWSFTDDFVELIKDRAYGARGEQEQASVLTALATTLDALLRLFAPFLPFVTEEIWSWWRAGSVHRAEYRRHCPFWRVPCWLSTLHRTRLLAFLLSGSWRTLTRLRLSR